MALDLSKILEARVAAAIAADSPTAEKEAEVLDQVIDSGDLKNDGLRMDVMQRIRTIHKDCVANGDSPKITQDYEDLHHLYVEKAKKKAERDARKIR